MTEVTTDSTQLPSDTGAEHRYSAYDGDNAYPNRYHDPDAIHNDNRIHTDPSAGADNYNHHNDHPRPRRRPQKTAAPRESW